MVYRVRKTSEFSLAGDLDGKPFVRVVTSGDDELHLERASFDEFPDTAAIDASTRQRLKILSFVVRLDNDDDPNFLRADIRSVQTSDRNWRP